MANEVKATNLSAKCMFRQRKETPTRLADKTMVETRDAMVGMVVAYNDRPLNPDERQGEYGRIQRFIDDPAELERKRQKEQEDSERVKSILKACQKHSSTNTTALRPAGQVWERPEIRWYG